MAHRNFHHPFQPYDIQQDFMEKLYDCIDRGGVGIFESPTGTGKSLSLICGSLTWLREHKRKAFEEAVASVEVDDDDDEPSWMIDQARDVRRQELRQARDELEARLRAVRHQAATSGGRQAHGKAALTKRKREDIEDDDDEQFLLDDYDSDEDVRKRAPAQKSILSLETDSLMQELGIAPPKPAREDGKDDEDELKVLFCSRTHSQLSQFVGELRRVQLPPVLPPTSPLEAHHEDLKQLSLGSRKNLCINLDVTKLVDQTAINERCIELQQSKTPVDKKCPFLPKKDEEDIAENFRAHALSKPQDIEDLARLGTKLQVCPYYASRSAIAPAEMITLPYPLLLQKSSRDALGLSLKGHVVIIDEAHNLLDAIEGIYSTQVSQHQLQLAKDALMTYLGKFRKRLKGSNRVYVAQVVRTVDSLLSYIRGLTEERRAGGTVSPTSLLAGKGVDQIDLTKLVAYISQSKLARKVEGYSTHLSAQAAAQSKDGKTVQPPPRTPNLSIVQDFLATLINPSSEGQFFWEKERGSIRLRYMLLDPSEHFRSVVEDARAVILAGGTMSPMEDYQLQLFPYLKQLTTFSCGHLIPPDNLLLRKILADQYGSLRFDFKARNDLLTSKRIGSAIAGLAEQVEGGMVVFFPSYGFLEKVISDLRQEFPTVLRSMSANQPVFFDSRRIPNDDQSSAPVEDTFKAYSDAVSSNLKRGAILCSVIGGKLSEGINFSDDLGRCVLVIGLPFPNLDTPEWRAKMKYIDTKAQSRGVKGNSASQAHVENVCMRAVNQAIGRVIRHKDDWASILLMDSRYGEARVSAKLPGWIRDSASSVSHSTSTTLEQASEDLRTFFKGR